MRGVVATSLLITPGLGLVPKALKTAVSGARGNPVGGFQLPFTFHTFGAGTGTFHTKVAARAEPRMHRDRQICRRNRYNLADGFMVCSWFWSGREKSQCLGNRFS